MKSRHAIAASILIAAVLAPAFAQENPVSVLAKQSGLSERKVRMLVGNRSAYAEYRATYDRSRKQLIKAVGRSNYERLLSGQPIELAPQPVDRHVDGDRSVADIADHD